MSVIWKKNKSQYQKIEGSLQTSLSTCSKHFVNVCIFATDFLSLAFLSFKEGASLNGAKLE